MTRFLHGASLLARGWRLLKTQKKLWLWVSIPLLIDLLILFLGWAQGISFLQTLVAGTIANWAIEGWLFNVLYYPLLLILGFGFCVIWLLFVVAVATVVAAPFNAFLAEKALQSQGISTVNTSSLSQWTKHTLRMLGVSWLKAMIFAAMAGILFVVSFIPGLNIVTAYFSMCLLAADVFDYSFEARGLSLKQRGQYLNRVKTEICGLGATLSLTSLLPGFTLLALPVAIVGATTFVAQREKQV